MSQNNQSSIFARLAGIFIANRQLGILSIITIVAFGLLGFGLMPKQYNPEIVAPAFRIITEFPQATQEEVYELITRPMEDVVRQIAQVDDIFAQSQSGRAVMQVTFDIGADTEAAKINLVQRLRSNMPSKPIGAHDPVVVEIATDDVPIVTLALTSSQFSPVGLRSFAFDVSDSVQSVDEVARIDLRGGEVVALRVDVDSDKLAVYGMDIAQVTDAITRSNVHVWQGQWEGTTHAQTMRIFGALTDISTIEQIIVAQNTEVPVRLHDVARVTIAPADTTHYTRLNTKNIDGEDISHDTVYIGIAKQAGSNATTVSDAIVDKVAQLQSAGVVPAHVDIAITRNDGAVARTEIMGLTTNLAISIVIVVVILLLFLDFGSAFIVAVAIPLTLLAVFGIGMLLGQTLNRITLFALILSLGLLVDNATVVVENIHRHLKLHQKNKQKNDKDDDTSRANVITNAVAEVGGALTMSTVTTVLAFIPMAFVGGMMGPYMGPIPFFVSAAIIVSLVIALTINPFVAHAVFARISDTRKQSHNMLSRLQDWVMSGVNFIQERYAHFLQIVFVHRRLRRTLLGVVGVLLIGALVLPATGLVPFRMLPKADRNQFFVYVDLPQSAAIGATNTATAALVAEIVKHKQVASVQSFVGIASVIDFNGLFKGSDSRTKRNQATLKVNLSDVSLRSEMSEDIATDIRLALVPIALNYDAQIAIIEDPPGPPVLATFDVKIQGQSFDDYAQLQEVARSVAQITRTIEGVTDIALGTERHSPEITYRVNHIHAAQAGVDTARIMQVLQTSVMGSQVGLYHDTLQNDTRYAEQKFIIVRAESDDRNAATDIEHMTVLANNGKLVALSALLEPINMHIVETIMTDNRQPTISISGEMTGRSVVYASIDMLHALYDFVPAEGYERNSWNLFGMSYINEQGKVLNIRLGGEWELTLEVFTDMGIAYGAAIFLIYFVLVAQFRSLRTPLYILITIPLSLIGVLPGFALLYLINDVYFTATAMIGVIALSGIVVNNAIIYLEYVMVLERDGVHIDEALVRAGRVRLVPILLTSLTTILASLTIVSDPVWEGLAWAIITGLSLSAFLTLIVLPIVYRKFHSYQKI